MANGNTQESKSQKMKSAGETAKSKSDQDKTSGIDNCPPKNSDWIEIELVGPESGPICSERCIVIDSEGNKHKGRTDAKGVLRVEGLPKGECEVSFVDLDGGAWGPEE